jgi:hypothetical protein
MKGMEKGRQATTAKKQAEPRKATRARQPISSETLAWIKGDGRKRSNLTPRFQNLIRPIQK